MTMLGDQDRQPERPEDAYAKCAAQVTADLLECSIRLQRLLAAADLFPLCGLYEGHYAEQAIRRYWELWMPLLLQHVQTREPAAAALLVPPLDVQWAWFVHRLNPNKYLDDCRARFGRELHPAGPQQALGFSGCSDGCSTSGGSSTWGGGSSQQGPHAGAGGAGDGGRRPLSESEEYTRRAWAAAYPSGPGRPPEHVLWPPAPAWLAAAVAATSHGAPQPAQPQAQGGGAGAPLDQAQGQGQGQAQAQAQDNAEDKLAAGSTASVRRYVIEAMPRQGRFLHQVLRAPYLSPAWLAAGVDRYRRFLAMARTRSPAEPLLVPMYDIDLVWHSHMALSGAYAADCRALLPSGGGSSTGGSSTGSSTSGSGGRVLGHDDGLAGPALADPFAFTRRKYETELGLMYNVAPTRRIPTSLAHPLVAAVWPLAAVLSDPRPPAPPPPPPRAVAAQLAAQAAEPQRRLSCTVVAADGSVSWGPGGARNPAAAAAALAGGRSKSGGRSTDKAAGAGAAAGSSNGGGAGFATATGEWAQCMLGSPDHLKRSGAVGMFALWRLAEALQQLASKPGVSGSSSGGGGGGGGGGGSTGGGGGGSTVGGGSSSGGGLRQLFSCLAGGGGRGDARVDAAMSRMADDLLQLADPAHPDSPLTSSDHPFWRFLLPLPAQLRPAPGGGVTAEPRPAPRPGPEPEPASSAAGAGVAPGSKSRDASAGADAAGVHINITASAAGAAAAPTTSHPCATPPPGLPSVPRPPAPPRPSRFPAPPPALDVPAGFAPASARDVDCVWLAPHHFALPAPVFYTHADFCALGRGSWCLPACLVSLEASGGSGDPRHVLPLQPPPQEPGAHTPSTSSGSSEGRQQQQHQPHTDAGEDWDFEWEEEWAVARGGRSHGGGRDGGRGSSINALGLIVHSPAWHKRLLRCYSRVYAELMRRRKAPHPDRDTAIAWGLQVACSSISASGVQSGSTPGSPPPTDRATAARAAVLRPGESGSAVSIAACVHSCRRGDSAGLGGRPDCEGPRDGSWLPPPLSPECAGPRGDRGPTVPAVQLPQLPPCPPLPAPLVVVAVVIAAGAAPGLASGAIIPANGASTFALGRLPSARKATAAATGALPGAAPTGQQVLHITATTPAPTPQAAAAGAQAALPQPATVKTTNAAVNIHARSTEAIHKSGSSRHQRAPAPAADTCDRMPAGSPDWLGEVQLVRPAATAAAAAASGPIQVLWLPHDLEYDTLAAALGAALADFPVLAGRLLPAGPSSRLRRLAARRACAFQIHLPTCPPDTGSSSAAAAAAATATSYPTITAASPTTATADKRGGSHGSAYGGAALRQATSSAAALGAFLPLAALGRSGFSQLGACGQLPPYCEVRLVRGTGWMDGRGADGRGVTGRGVHGRGVDGRGVNA
ncbi:hypothetical protein HXX76_002288 [Chlamydomonas incerta]|uniref:Uncharacterized protein n=1 Tax=Chlamydomonas incerta TaxID=51695 RepID=A0A836B0S9_CHLIN|nr:hypothetical protein HXX76_002288 [Chlamydomonas incerta]|eukprot:KAG2443949.1 hypothetical protein HXX76_002288 [Chlamydomonas incerta]